MKAQLYNQRRIGQGRKRGYNWDYARKFIVIFATMFLAAGRTALVLFAEAMAAAMVLVVYGFL